MTLFPPSSQLHHRPVISFCVDPYISIPSPGEGVPLTYNPYLGPGYQGRSGGGGHVAISQLPGSPGGISLLLPSFGATPAPLLLCPCSLLAFSSREQTLVKEAWLPWSPFLTSQAFQAKVNRM